MRIEETIAKLLWENGHTDVKNVFITIDWHNRFYQIYGTEYMRDEKGLIRLSDIEPYEPLLNHFYVRKDFDEN